MMAIFSSGRYVCRSRSLSMNIYLIGYYVVRIVTNGIKFDAASVTKKPAAVSSCKNVHLQGGRGVKFRHS